MTHKHRRKNGVTFACDCDDHDRLAAELSAARAALDDMAAFFRSGNSVPVERATIYTSHPSVQRMFAALGAASSAGGDRS